MKLDLVCELLHEDFKAGILPKADYEEAIRAIKRHEQVDKLINLATDMKELAKEELAAIQNRVLFIERGIADIKQWEEETLKGLTKRIARYDHVDSSKPDKL